MGKFRRRKPCVLGLMLIWASVLLGLTCSSGQIAQAATPTTQQVAATSSQTPKPQGAAQKFGQYVTVTSPNYSVWGNFDWAVRNHSAKLYHHTYLAQVAYHHANGSTYYSLYAGKKWLGYLNARAVKVGQGAQGGAVATNQYVTITKKNFTVWGDFAWRKKRANTKNAYHVTLQAKIIYYHSNGSAYYSLYRNGKWFGYLNASAVQVAKGAQGIAVGANKYVKITSKRATVWGGFNWQSKHLTKNWFNHVFQVKCVYYHSNGSVYYSLYQDGWWFGYLNATATKASIKPKATARSYAATSKTAKKTDQIVGVVASGSHAQVYLFEKSGGIWVQAVSVAGRVGYNGVGTAREGSGRTPRGAYPLTFAFGTGKNPGTKLTYRQITKQSYYISNTKDKQYNTWQERRKSSSKDEHLADYPIQYQYGIVIGYNHGVGGGSAFFLHVNGRGATAGCVSVPRSTMLSFMRRIHNGARIINVTSAAQLAKY